MSFVNTFSTAAINAGISLARILFTFVAANFHWYFFG